MWFSVVCTLIDNEYAISYRSKCCRLTRRSRVSPQQLLTNVMTRIINVKEHFFRARAEKLTRAALSGLDNGKLANQIARLTAIVVKLYEQ